MDSRLRNEAVDDGLYSDVEGGATESVVAVILEEGFLVRDLRAPRERMATRWGADFVRDSSLEVAGLGGGEWTGQGRAGNFRTSGK